MAEFYVTRLWLTCDSADQSVQDAFHERWTPAIEQAWESLVSTYDPTKTQGQNEDALCSFLSGKIGAQFAVVPGGNIPVDLADANYGYQSLITVFNSSSWSVGSGGLHESTQPVNANVTMPGGGTGRAQWPIKGKQGSTGYVFAHCEWRKVIGT